MKYPRKDDCKLYVKNLYTRNAAMTTNSNRTLKFNIGMADNEVLLIKSIHAHLRPSDLAVDRTFAFQWAVMAIDHQGEDDYEMTNFSTLDSGGTISKDNDVIAYGQFGRTTIALGQQFIAEPQRLYFDPPIIIPVSPSVLIVNAGADTNTFEIGFSIYYHKKIVSRGEVLRSLKKYPGRAHNRVSNEPPHQSAGDANGP